MSNVALRRALLSITKGSMRRRPDGLLQATERWWPNRNALEDLLAEHGPRKVLSELVQLIPTTPANRRVLLRHHLKMVPFGLALPATREERRRNWIGIAAQLAGIVERHTKRNLEREVAWIRAGAPGRTDAPRAA